MGKRMAPGWVIKQKESKLHGVIETQQAAIEARDRVLYEIARIASQQPSHKKGDSLTSRLQKIATFASMYTSDSDTMKAIIKHVHLSVDE